MSPRTRWFTGIAAVAIYLGVHAWLGGLRSDHAWLALAGLALWLAPKRARTIALFIAPFLIMAMVYDAQRYWAATWRGPVHVTGPYVWELAWFGIGTAGGKITPAGWWQLHHRSWLDLVCGSAYLLFLPGFIAMAAWWRFRESRPEGQEVWWAMLWLYLAAYATFLIYPAAPPWYVDHYGLGPAVLTAPRESGGAARFDALLGVSWFAQFYGHSTNVFGAIPSLHVGQTFLAVIYAWRFHTLRVLATVFWALVLFASVYLNHHYIVDGLAGMVLAVGAAMIMTAWRRSRPALSPG